ncbi:unnamed protein product, partial [Staurois parvus]
CPIGEITLCFLSQRHNSKVRRNLQSDWNSLRQLSPKHVTIGPLVLAKILQFWISPHLFSRRGVLTTHGAPGQ